MPPWFTCLFCIGWLGNVQIFITRSEPLYNSLNHLFCVVFAAVVVCARSLLLWPIERVTMSSHQCSVCFYICDLNLEVIEIFQGAIIVFHTGKRLYHFPMDISGNSPRNFWSNSKRPMFLNSFWVNRFQLFSLYLSLFWELRD